MNDFIFFYLTEPSKRNLHIKKNVNQSELGQNQNEPNFQKKFRKIPRLQTCSLDAGKWGVGIQNYLCGCALL